MLLGLCACAGSKPKPEPEPKEAEDIKTVAGAVIVGGVDCIVDVGKTTSSIILGEDHQVTVDFEKAGDVIQPVSMVKGLVTMDPTSAVEQVAFLGEAMMEWCYPGKITGIAVEITKKGNALVLA